MKNCSILQGRVFVMTTKMRWFGQVEQAQAVLLKQASLSWLHRRDMLEETQRNDRKKLGMDSTDPLNPF